MWRAGFMVAALVGSAEAGPTNYGWLPPTETVAAGAIAIEGSVFERDNLGDSHERASILAVAPVVGVSDSTEVAVPLELASVSATDVAPHTSFSKFGIEARHRFASRDATWIPVARFAVIRDTAIRTELRLEGELAVGFRRGKLHAEIDVGLVSEINLAGLHDEARFGVGASYQVCRCLRLGAELHGEHALDANSTSWAAIGPTLGWTHRRFWLSAALDIGIQSIVAAPRINWGMTW